MRPFVLAGELLGRTLALLSDCLSGRGPLLGFLHAPICGHDRDQLYARVG